MLTDMLSLNSSRVACVWHTQRGIGAPPLRFLVLFFCILALMSAPAHAGGIFGGGGGGGMTYPAAGVPQSTGAAWDTSLTLDTDCSAVSGSDDSICSAKTTKAQLDTKYARTAVYVGFTASDTTPSVAGGDRFYTQNILATTITALDNPVDGQKIIIFVQDNQTTWSCAGGNLLCNGGVNYTTANGDVIEGYYLGGALWQLFFYKAAGIIYPGAFGTAYQLLHTNASANGLAWTSTLGAAGTRLTAGYFTDLAVTNAIAGSTTGNVANTLYDAYSIIYADTDDTPARLTVGASTIVGRAAAGGIAALTTANMKTLLGYPTSGEYAGMTVSTDSASGACGPGTFWFESDAKILSLCSASGTWNALYQVCDPASGNCYLQLTKNTAAHTPVVGTYRLLFDNVSGALKVSISDTGEYFVADTSTAQTLTNKTLTAPAITTAEVDGHTTSTDLTAAQVSNTVITNYDQAASDVFLILPAAASGYSFLANVATAQANHWCVEAQATDKIYLIAAAGTIAVGDDGAAVCMMAAQVGQQFACWTFKTGATAYDWACKAIAIGTSTFEAHASSE